MHMLCCRVCQTQGRCAVSSVVPGSECTHCAHCRALCSNQSPCLSYAFKEQARQAAQAALLQKLNKTLR